MNNLSEDALVSINPFKITSADTDMEARLSLGALINFLIQSAINSADSLGFGLGGLRQQQLFWVLNRLTVEILTPLKWYDNIIVETWPKDVERILYLRDFIVRDNDKQIAVRATSAWTAIEMATKRPKQIEGLHAGMFNHLKNKHAMNEQPLKLNAVESGETFEFRSAYCDTDLNRHVTSTRYIDWMMDTFTTDFHVKNYPKRLIVNYLKETMPGDTLRFTRQQMDDSRFLFEAVNTRNEMKSFRGLVVF